MSRVFGSRQPARPHLLRGSHGLTREVADLAGDIEAAFQSLEDPSAGPLVETLPAATASIATVNGAGLAFSITGQNFLQGQTFATATLTGPANGDLTFSAVIPGVGGNAISVTVVDSAGGGLAVTVNGTDIQIDQGGSGSNATAVAAAVNAHAAASLLVECAAGGTGAGVVPVAAQTLLTGGGAAARSGRSGSGVQLVFGGNTQSITVQVTDTVVVGRLDDGTGLSAGEVASIWVVSDGVRSNPMQVTIAA